MKKNLFKLFVLMLVVPTIMVSCEEENEDTTLPGQVDSAEAIAQDQSVLIKWTDPTDTDFEKVVITYTNDIEYNIDVMAGVQEKIIEGLTNDQEYTFKLKTVDKSGNESFELTLTSTPELTIYTISGFEIENGTYKVTDEYDFIITYVFSGTNTLNSSLQAGTNNFSWSGTWTRMDVSVITDLVNDNTQDTFIDTISAAFCFELDGEKFYYSGAYEKISGQPDELTGKYEYSISDDNGTTTKSIKIFDDGTYELITNKVFDKYGSWSDDDIRNKEFVFIDFMDKSFLYFPDSYVLKKQ